MTSILASVLLLTIAALVGATPLDWQPRTPYPGPARHHPITFANETHGFLLTGSTNYDSATLDFYIYDEAVDEWSDITHTPSAFPGPARSFGYGVVLNEFGNTKAYVGFGASSDGERLADLWEFDMSTHRWRPLTEFPGYGRRHPAMNPVRTSDGKWEIHVGLGDTYLEDWSFSNLNDWWAYSVENDEWKQLPSPNIQRRHHPFYFSIGTMSYAGFGHGRGIYRDWYGFDTVRDEWTSQPELASYNVVNNKILDSSPVSTEARVAGTQFSIELPLEGGDRSGQLSGSLGFVLSGDGETHDTMALGEFLAFYPKGNNFGIDGPDGSAVSPWWRNLPPHPGVSRWAPGSFVIRGTARAYFTSGYDRMNGYLYNDLWLIDLSTLFQVANNGELKEETVEDSNDPTMQPPALSSSPMLGSFSPYTLATFIGLTGSLLIGLMV